MYTFVICTYLAKSFGKIWRNRRKYVVQALHFGLNPAVTQFTLGWKNYEFLSPHIEQTKAISMKAHVHSFLQQEMK